MKAITITEPWATLIAIGVKQIETRSWSTDYRGPIAIHAAKGMKSADLDCAYDFETELRPSGIRVHPNLKAAFHQTRGCVIATATLTHCGCFTQESVAKIRSRFGERELSLGDFTVGRFGFVLSNIVRLPEPIPAKGALGLWEWEPPVELAVAS